MTRRTDRPIVGLAVVTAAVVAACALAQAQAPAPAQNVVIITIDGLRWQEFFGGANRDYFHRDSDGNAGEPEQRFWRDSPEERRRTLFPFIWSTMATRGQVFGDPSADSESRVTNGLWFSYPGYSEMFAGVADPRIASNDKIPNPNVTVLEWLNRRPGFEGRVAAFGSWDVLPSILNIERSGLPVGTGYRPVPSPATPREQAINELATDLASVLALRPLRRAHGLRRARAPADRQTACALRHVGRGR